MRADLPPGGTAGRARRTRSGRTPRDVHVSVLGEFAVAAGGSERAVPRDGQRLVALLALSPGGLHRSVAARRLTPHLEAASAQSSLRKTLTRLRATRLPLIEADGGMLRLHPRATVDLREAEALAARLTASPDEDIPDDRLEILAREPLLGWSEGWAERAREALRGRFLRALDARARRLAARGERDRALAVAQLAWDAHPLRETTAGVVIGIHIADENRAQALDLYLGFARQLADELGVEPAQQLRELVAPLLRSRPGP